MAVRSDRAGSRVRGRRASGRKPDPAEPAAPVVKVLLAAVAIAAVTAAPAAASDDASGGSGLTVSQETVQVTTSVGERFSFVSTVSNTTTSPATGLVANLNVVSLDPNVYVDPEDWSTQRTQFL